MSDDAQDRSNDQEREHEEDKSSGRANDPLAQRDQQAPRTDWKPDK